jgi:hypothetical protein
LTFIAFFAAVGGFCAAVVCASNPASFIWKWVSSVDSRIGKYRTEALLLSINRVWWLLVWGRRSEQEAAEACLRGLQGWGGVLIIRTAMGSIIPTRQHGEQSFWSKISLQLLHLFPSILSSLRPTLLLLLLLLLLLCYRLCIQRSVQHNFSVAEVYVLTVSKTALV